MNTTTLVEAQRDEVLKGWRVWMVCWFLLFTLVLWGSSIVLSNLTAVGVAAGFCLGFPLAIVGVMQNKKALQIVALFGAVLALVPSIFIHSSWLDGSVWIKGEKTSGLKGSLVVWPGWDMKKLPITNFDSISSHLDFGEHQVAHLRFQWQRTLTAEMSAKQYLAVDANLRDIFNDEVSKIRANYTTAADVLAAEEAIIVQLQSVTVPDNIGARIDSVTVHRIVVTSDATPLPFMW